MECSEGLRFQQLNFLRSRMLQTVMFLLLSKFSYSSTYYFSSSSGNDSYTSAQAQNPNTPWKTLSKLNTFFGLLNAGDTVRFKRGDVFTGSIIATKSGAPFAPIVFSAYGSGNTPEISGFTQLGSWTLKGNGIYESPVNTVVGNNLLINGAQQPLGRYPNKGYLSYESHNGNIS